MIGQTHLVDRDMTSAMTSANDTHTRARSRTHTLKVVDSGVESIAVEGDTFF